MMKRFSVTWAVFVLTGLAHGNELTPVRPAGTFSIVAHDPATGELGVGVQSHWFSVGSDVSWAQSGVGAVATQSFIEPGYGARGLELLASGKAPQSALEELLAKDPNRDVRQVAFIDARGNVAVHTGKMCIPAAGHKTGENYSVQGNLLDSPGVWQEMARAFEQSRGALADRILEALVAGQAAGGDVRGKQSAALVVVRVVSEDEPWRNRVVDLRVEDHPAPITELKRLLDLRKAYDLANQGDGFLADQDFENAFKAYNAALEIVPENDELIFWRGAMLMQSGRESEALADIRRAVALNPRWLKLLERIQPEHFPGAKEVLEKVR
jgi:uncharacterized Ntn-hydrolase superfamily protein